MELIDEKSLASTLNNLNYAFFFKKEISKSEKEKVALWISSRQGLKGSYSNMFAPTDDDFKNKIKLFTGEKIISNLAISHILGEESLRALKLLDVKVDNVSKSLVNATNGLKKYLDLNKNYLDKYGFYCCGKCSVSLWRNIASGGLNDYENILDKGIKTLKSLRDNNGKWKRFPFFYTILFLSEVNLPSAKEELKYTLNYCERILKHRISPFDKIKEIRKTLIENILNTCS